MSAVLREASNIQWVTLSMIDAHPQNPRLVMREDVVAQIASQLSENGYQPKHAIHIRPVNDRYQVISGHHRLAAAAGAGLAEVPAWVETMDDDRAYMALVLSNAQGELSPLEIGMHALHYVAKGNGGRGKTGGLSEYAKRVGRDRKNVERYRDAAEVCRNMGIITHVSALLTKAAHLSAIHALLESCWPVAVEAMLAKGWSAADTKHWVDKAHEYDFNERMAMSSGVSATADVRGVLLATIPGAVAVSRAAAVNDRQGIDWWVELSTARHLAVDAKVRSIDWAATHPDEDDLALETWSVVEKNIYGWTRDKGKRCDYVLWLWKDTGRYCLIPFPMLCNVFTQFWMTWKQRHKTRRQYTPRDGGGYHSECVFVPRREVWAVGFMSVVTWWIIRYSDHYL